MTEAERLIWDEYLKNYPSDRGTAPPAETPRTPAEWEEMQGVVITWAAYQQNLREIVRHAKQYVTVYIVCSNPTTVQNYLAEGGVNADNIVFVEADFDSVWVRDYGPQSIYLNGTNELAFVDWVYNRPRPNDDVIPSVMGTELGVPVYQMTQVPNRLTATGGNFMTDGYDQGFSSELIFEENSTLTEGEIDNIKYSYMG
ncbi:MAG TPA: agmatine deiminase family protein, partial [Tenuifilaceae bacterium]|nr:agmatine deiminase family protein [Tenuifilaceae bacterium]